MCLYSLINSPGLPGDLPHPSRENDGGREGGAALIFAVDEGTPKNKGGENWGNHRQKEVIKAQGRLHPAHVSPIPTSDSPKQNQTREGSGDARTITSPVACATVMEKTSSVRSEGPSSINNLLKAPSAQKISDANAADPCRIV